MANNIFHAALPYPIKNARYTVWAGYLDADGDPTDPTSPDTEISTDGSGFVDCVEEVTVLTGGNGQGYITLTGAETNCSLLALAFKGTGPKTSIAYLAPRLLPILRSGTLQAGTSGTVQLDAGAPAIDGYYTGCIVRTTGGTGGGGTGGANNQARQIISYVGSTRTANVQPIFEVAPDATTTFDILLTEVALFSFGDVIAISNDGIAADNLETMLDGTGGSVLSLKQLNIVNSTGDALVANSTGGSGSGISATGNGTAPGSKCVGAGTGPGIVATGGPSGPGIQARGGATTGYGIHALAQGGTGQHGMIVEGFGTGSGLVAQGGTGAGADGARYIAGTGSNGDGAEYVKDGSGLPMNPAASGGLSAAQTADAVWDAATTGNTTGGTMGGLLNSAGSAGDPWGTALPGSYVAGTAANIVGNPADVAAATRGAPGAAMGLSAGAITTGSFAAGAINANAIATDAIGAAELAADAVTEIQAGLATATNLAAVKTDTASILTAVDTEVAAIKAKTDNLPAQPAAAGDAMTLSPAERTAIANTLLDLADAIEAGVTLRQSQRAALAVLAGKVSGAGTGTESFRNAVADTKPRIVSTVDPSGNRVAITADLT